MPVLVLVQESLGNLGVYPPQNVKKFRLFNERNVCGLALFMLFNILSAMSIICVAETMSEYSDALFIFTKTMILSGFYINFVVKAQATFILVEKFENIVQKRFNNQESKDLYETTRKNLEKWIRIIFLIMAKLTPILFTIPAFIVTVVEHFTGTLNEDDIRMAFSFWFPFDWKSFPIGYSVAFCFQFFAAVVIFGTIASLLTVFVGFCMFLLAMTTDIRQQLNNLNEIDENNGDKKEHMEKFCEIIQLHSDTIQCANDLTNLIKYMLLLNFGWSLITICTNLLLLFLEISSGTQGDIDVVANLLFKTLYSFILIFILCELGERVRFGFEKIGNEINNMNWYLFSIKMQRMIPTMQITGQQDIQLMAFGNFPCSRDNFKKIVNAGYSCFSLIRGLS